MNKKNNYDVEAHQGATFLRRFVFAGTGPHGTHSLEDSRVRLHVLRENAEGPLEIECDLDNQRLTLLDAKNGLLQWKLAPQDTQGIKFPKGEDHLDCVYSIEITDRDGDIHVPVRAAFRLYRSITR